MQRHHNLGFTMVELVVVIILLGILMSVAVPRFFDMTDDANDSATASVAAALAAASAKNYGLRKANGTKGSAVTNCTDIGSLNTGLLPSGYVISSLAIASDTTVDCTVTSPDTTTQKTFAGIGIP